MSPAKKQRIGISGTGRRGTELYSTLTAAGADACAVCDVDADRLEQFARETGTKSTYTEYEAMLDDAKLDAVVVASPILHHAPQCVTALERDLHVLSEVPAAVSLEQSRKLVDACQNSKGTYMIGENLLFSRNTMHVREMVKRGWFGDLYYAEGEYLHDLKLLIDQTAWRRQWQAGIAGITYGTHALGPIMLWMDGDRVSRVCSESSGSHCHDSDGEAYAQDTAVMLCKTDRGALIKIRLDLVSERPNCVNRHQLQGTEGVFDSGCCPEGGSGQIWLRRLGAQARWFDLDTVGEECIPDVWRDPDEAVKNGGHCGADTIMARDFLRAIRGEPVTVAGIHEAMTMTLPGLMSQASVAQGGVWLDVPDSRQWPGDKTEPQLQMVLFRNILNAPPQLEIPPGYELRCFHDTDEAAYLTLMAKAGFTGFTHDTVVENCRVALPDGFFVIIHRETDCMVATAIAGHLPTDLHPQGGMFHFVAADPAHSGRGLGKAVSAVVLARLIGVGYRDIYLCTDDFRLPAIKIYLDLGFEPFHFHPGMKERWQKVFTALRRRP